MAYTKLRDMLDLALELQASSLGLTIDQLMARTGRSRKTVERMLQGLTEIGLEMEPSRLESDHHLTKRCVGWCRVEAIGPKPLVQRAKLKHGLIVQEESLNACIVLAQSDLPQSEVTVDPIGQLIVFEKGQTQVIEERGIGGPGTCPGHRQRDGGGDLRRDGTRRDHHFDLRLLDHACAVQDFDHKRGVPPRVTALA